MRPFHFGESREPLYGVFSAGARGPATRAALLLNPFGEEAIRAFRPLRLLAERLGQNGIPTLRFDYYGTGDSAGEGDEVTLARMAEDVAMAHDELEAVAHTDNITWIALRLGAAAGHTALKEVTPDRALLWEPVLGPSDMPAIADRTELDGFPLPDVLRGEIERLDAVKWPASTEIVVLDRTERPVADARHVDLPPQERWNADAALNSYQVPNNTLDLLVTEVCR